MDCMVFMKQTPDKFFDICLADPPYGIDINSSGHLVREKGWEYKTWDKDAPSTEWFKELRRVSKHCIIWGANHFIDRVPINSKAWVVWDKRQPENFSFAMCELALTDFEDKTAKIFRYSPSQQSVTETRIHPTQKPVALYAWLLKNYAKEGDTIFDPMAGSQASRIAAYKMGFDYVGCELDKEYFEKGCERFNRECKGILKLQNGKTAIEQTLF